MEEKTTDNSAVVKKGGLTSSGLKLIAMFSMLIDHIGAGFLEKGYLPYLKSLYGSSSAIYDKWNTIDSIMRCIGRLAFPIFCFVLVEGFLHTRDIKKYIVRLIIFAIVSEIPFDLCFRKATFNWKYQNVIWTMLLGIIAMAFVRFINDGRSIRSEKSQFLLTLFVFVGFGMIAVLMRTDYNATGVMLILIMYLLREREFFRDIAGAVDLLGAGYVEIASYPSFILMHFYNGERGANLKYLFYVFYPLHLLIIACIRIAVFGG